MKTFSEQKTSVKSFMEAVEEERLRKTQEDAFQASTDYKLKVLDREQDAARGTCLNKVFCNIYKNALPLSNDYKNANCEDLDKAFSDFIKTRCPEGIEFYVKEAIRKNNSPFARKVLEAVDEFVNNEFRDRALRIEDIDAKDLVFKTTDDTTRRLDVIGQNLQGQEISQAVHDNVKATALSEITRAKNEKEALANLEKELANDVNINTPAAVESALELRGFGKKDFAPSLFQGIMINKMNSVQAKMESGEISDVILYGTMEEYGKPTNESVNASAEEIAFVECVKEYTGHQLMKALKMEKYYKNEVADMAMKYAQS